MVSHPLAGMRVLDLTRLLPGAVCTMVLVDMGADVIKIESPGGGDYARWFPPTIDGQSVFFRMNNRSKRSMILDLKQEQGQGILKKLVESADVLIESYRPGVMQRLNCDYDTLKGITPKLVYCALSGWGVDGPYAQQPNHDLNYVAVAGLSGAMQDPQVMGGQVADIGGAYIAVAGILAALLRRERTGEGAFVDTSLSEAALPFALYNWVEAMSTGVKGGQGMLTGGYACYRIYQTRDKEAVALGALEEKFWTNFCNAIERTDLIEDYLLPRRQEYLIKEIAQTFSLKTLHEWDQLLTPADCCFTIVRNPDKIADDPHYQARGMLGTFQDGTPWMRSPVRLSESQPIVENNVPRYGEHTREVLLEAGYEKYEIDAFEAQEIIG